MSRKLVRPPGIPDDAILRIVRVPPESAGKRVDVFLQTQLRGTSRTRSRAIVEKSGYSLDGRKLRAWNQGWLTFRRDWKWEAGMRNIDCRTRIFDC